MKEVLEETHGVMIYQEQVMRILNRLGGIELSQAYACIKAISKKKTEVIAQGRKQFLDGAVERGLERETATKIFDLIEYFGGYGFNKSHSTAYALVLFQTAYLKAHYPTEFMAALLSSEMDGAEREKFFVEHIDDCRKMGVEVLPPNINEGEATFQVDGTEGSAVAGLSDCMIQPRQATPRPVWNPDEKRNYDFYADWQKMPDNVIYENGFKEQWEMFIRHVLEDAPYKYTLLEGAKGVQLVECALQSWKERRFVDVPPLSV